MAISQARKRLDRKTDMNSFSIVVPTARRRIPRDLPRMVRVLLGIASPEEELTCYQESDLLTPDEWAKVYALFNRHSTRRSERSIGQKQQRVEPSYLDAVGALYRT